MMVLAGCIPNESTLKINLKKDEKVLLPASVSSVQIINHQLVIHGLRLDNVNQVKVSGHSLNETFTIESISPTQIIANSISVFSFDVSKIFSLILSDANASATFQIDFSLCNASLHGAGFDCATTLADNDVLTYDLSANKWTPKSLSGLGQTDGAMVPPNTILLMNSCAAGWTDTGAMPGGVTGATCTLGGTQCRKCQSPATASRIPASTTLLMESCPSGWTHLGQGVGPGLAGRDYLMLLQMCQSPAVSSGLSINAKVLATSCPATWTDVGSTLAVGPQSADCGSGQCRICSVSGGVAARTLEGGIAVSPTSNGGSVAIVAGYGGTTSGDGGSINIVAGNSSGGASAFSGTVNIQAGVNTGATNGNIILSSGSTTVGTAGNILLNPYLTGRVGIGTDVPGKLLSVNGEMEAQTVTASTISGTTVNAVNSNTVGNTDNWVVNQIRNLHIEGIAGTSYVSSNGTPKGFTGYANTLSPYFPDSVFISSTDATPLAFGIAGIEAMRVAIDGGIQMGASAPPLTYRMVVAGGGIDIVSGGVRATLAYNQTSDIRLKTHIDYLESEDALEKILSLKGIYYDWKDQEKMGFDRQLGLSAQDVQKVFPEAVKKDSKGFLSVGYSTLIAPLIEAVKELDKRVNELFSSSDLHSRAISSLQEDNKQKDKKIKILEEENALMKVRMDKIEKSLQHSKN